MACFVVRSVNGKMTLVPKEKAKPLVSQDARSSLAFPSIIGTFKEPLQSMADGKWYTDAASLRRSYKAANNPQGVDYLEVGNEDITKFSKPKRDRKADRDAIERAISDVASGNAPPVLTKFPV